MKKLNTIFTSLGFLGILNSASAQTYDFDSGVAPFTNLGGNLQWSGPSLSNAPAVDPSVWGGLTTLPTADGTDFAYMYDSIHGPDRFITFATGAATQADFITYDYINTSGDHSLGAGLNDLAEVVITDGVTYLGADVYNVAADMTSWTTITASYDVALTPWVVLPDANGWTGAAPLATQAQVDSIISTSSWIVHAGLEQIPNGASGGGLGAEIVAIDNLNIGTTAAVPEPSSALLGLLGGMLFMAKRKR